MSKRVEGLMALLKSGKIDEARAIIVSVRSFPLAQSRD
jgi:hypothetical protein